MDKGAARSLALHHKPQARPYRHRFRPLLLCHTFPLALDSVPTKKDPGRGPEGCERVGLSWRLGRLGRSQR